MALIILDWGILGGLGGVIGVPPIQYIKKIKLHKVRELLIYQEVTAKAAAYKVGYESLSQFNREYKRMFGVTPRSESII
jgi:AraC-like DNA-binding protein